MTTLAADANPLALGVGGDAIDQAQVVPAEQKGKSAEDGKGGVDEAPEERDAADRAGDEGQEKDAGAADEAEVDDPLVADRVAIGAEEEDGEEEMGECEPIGAVGEEGGGDGGGGEGEMDAEDPFKEWGTGAEVGGAGEEIEQELGLADEGKGGEAAEHQADDHESEAEANAGEQASALGRTDLGNRRHRSGMPRGGLGVEFRWQAAW